MNVFVYNIDWDTDGEDIESLDLPTEIELSDLPDYVADDINDGYSDALADYLSDTYYYCLYGFDFDVVE